MRPVGIYIADDLFYNLINVEARCREANIEIRMILNRLPLTSVPTHYSNKSPIYNPQDFKFLDDYISVGEFDCSTEYSKYDWVKAERLYHIWFEEQYWNDDLRFINPDIKFEVLSPCIPPELARYRSSCGLACVSHSRSSCKKCNRLFLLAKRNKENGIGYKKGVSTGLPSRDELMELLEKQEENNEGKRL